MFYERSKKIPRSIDKCQWVHVKYTYEHKNPKSEKS